jgi:hypothetical protein
MNTDEARMSTDRVSYSALLRTDLCSSVPHPCSSVSKAFFRDLRAACDEISSVAAAIAKAELAGQIA